MHDFDRFERRLANALRSDADASVGPFEAGSIARASIAASQSRATRVRQASPHARRFGRGRGITLLAAAALLLVGGALAAGSGILRLPTVVPPVPSPSVAAIATASPEVTSPSPSESAAPSASPIPVAGPGGIWIPTGAMMSPRYEHTAVRLQDGRVLVAGGSSDPEPGLTSAELYDPATGTWSATGNMIRPAGGFPAVLLRDGKVLVGDVLGDGRAGAELYDPNTGTWSATGPMVGGGGTATLLRDGKVLVRGDSGSELYNPDTGSWTATVSRPSQRHSHAAVLLLDGRVLVAGGHIDGDTATASAEMYDPDIESWTAIAKMHSKRETIEAFLLPDGKVLVVGSSRGDPLSAEWYDPATGAWTVIGDMVGPGGSEVGSGRLLSDGKVLVRPRAESSDAALFDPVSGSWMTAASMLESHYGASATALLDGTVLVAGGRDCLDDRCVAKGSAELYIPAGVSPPPLPAFPSPPQPVFPSPTPRPTPLQPAAGPVPPNARSWTVTVDNESSEPAALFVAEEDLGGTLRLVGSATPNVVPAGASVKVTFLFPARGDPDDGWIFVNPRPGEGGSLVSAADIGIPGKILLTADGQVGWLSP